MHSAIAINASLSKKPRLFSNDAPPCQLHHQTAPAEAERTGLINPAFPIVMYADAAGLVRINLGDLFLTFAHRPGLKRQHLCDKPAGTLVRLDDKRNRQQLASRHNHQRQ